MDAKSTMKRLVKKAGRPLITQINLRVNPAGLSARTAALEADTESLNRYLPTVVNTIASQNAASRENRRLLKNLETGLAQHDQGFQYLQQRIEFIRRELLFEQRYSDSDSRPQPDAVEPRGGQ